MNGSSALPKGSSPFVSFLRAGSTSLFAMLAIACVFTGCAGYQMGTKSLYRCDVKTIHLPMVQSDSYRRNLGEQLTEAIAKEIELSTPYSLVDADQADSILNVRLVSENKRVLAETKNDDVRDYETDFFVQMSWVDRRGDLIATGPRIPFAPTLVNISQTANFVPEGGQSLATAQKEALARLAAQIRGQMEAPW